MMVEEHPLKRLREYLEMSHQDLAEALGLARTYVLQVEQGRNRFGGKALLKISDLFGEEMDEIGVTVEDLLREGRPRPARGEVGEIGQGARRVGGQD
jgi:transcriptional regulator with XRE-family HTH domain